MKRQIALFLTLVIACESWSIPKPMESIENYNVMLLHGAYESSKGIPENSSYSSAYEDSVYLGGDASLGAYSKDSRITKWLSKIVFEEPDIGNNRNAKNSYIYHWRAFTNPANNSINNAKELGLRTWNKEKKFGQRRALIEEAQEVKAAFFNPGTGRNDSGQVALDSIRKYPDLYRQLASRYILIGHSMGGVVSREWIQNSDYYHNEVDKVITLDSPHEGTGALNMELDLKNRDVALSQHIVTDALMLIVGVAAMAGGPMIKSVGITSSVMVLAAQWIDYAYVGPEILNGLDDYVDSDPLVDYVDPLKKGKGHIEFLKTIEAHDSLPMFRLLGADSSITFTDPHKNIPEMAYFLVPAEIGVGVENFISQLYESDDIFSTYSFALASKAFTVGLMASASAREQGSSLVSKSSGWADNTISLTSGVADVRRARFNAAPTADSEAWRVAAEATAIAAAACLTADAALAWIKPAAIAANIAIAVGSAALIYNMVSSYLSEDLKDEMTYSHQRPLQADILDSLKANNGDERISYSYSRIKAGDTSLTPYLMNDFLYERPFVNLALNDTATLNKLQGMTDSARDASTLNRNCFYIGSRNGVNCAIGLFKSVNDLNSTQKNQPLSGLTTPIRFKSESDWSKMGVKVDRWEKVDGLHPDGSENKKGVPIRHVERYEVPAITVDDWIEKYSFIVDDLMPHRLRQIRMNFNYQEEIAWECDITKAPDSNDACTVYKRTSGSEWTELRKEKHPIKKNGQFDFEPRKYGYDNLLAIQKDNQNTVTISTVNKIGLSNTQRFYYLFKATANKLEPKWPLRGVALNKMKGFCSYASALGYQGFRVVGAKDKILTDSMGTYENLTENVDMQMAVSEFRDASGKLLYDSSSATFVSRQSAIDLTEGSYIWKYAANIENIESPSSHADTSNTYEVPFRIDRTPPKFEVVPESPLINPDSTPFAARFKWADSALATPDIRTMRWTLERASGQSSSPTFVHVCDFRSLYEVSTPDFAVVWNDNCRAQVKNLGDGLYRVKAFAVDYAVPDSNVYKKMNELVNAIAVSPNYVEQSRWPTDADSLNTSTEYASFTIDSHKPSLVLDSSKSVFTATADSLLKIAYVVYDQYFGPDSTPVTIRWDFVHAADTAKADRAGDSVWVKKDTVVGTWEERGSMRLEDGSYVLRAQVRDAAGNGTVYENLANLRVDKTVPYIESLVSSSLISPDSATLKVNEKFDVPSNRFGEECRYRILGGDADTNWNDVPRDSAKQYERVFALDSAVIGVSHGKRYLEVACKDAVGNVSYRTDLFHVGARYPTITSPDGSEMITSALVAITGMAPPSGLSNSEHAIFRLRYRNVDGLVPEHAAWQMSQAYVSQALRSGTQNVSRAAQVNEGVLGYIDRSTSEGEKIAGTYEIELSTCTADTASCYADTSLWISDTMTVFFNMVSHEVNDEKPTVKFALRVRDTLSPVSMTVGKDSLDVSLTLSGAFKNNYLIRVYAEGDDHVGIFEKSVSKAFRNPYYGLPADTVKSKGVWFYQDSLGYHLKWKGLPEGDSIKVSFASDRFGNTCESAADGANLGSCVVRASAFNFVDLPTVTRSYLEDFPEWIPPSYVDSVMMLAGDSGHVLMTAEATFQVSFVRDFADTSKSKIPVYFASSAKDGFYWGDLSLVSSDTLDPLVTGWTVNPQAYGLGFKWNGLMATDGYPSANSVKIFAEVTENISESPYIYIDSAVIALDKAPAEIVLANKLADYVVLEKDSASTSLDDPTQNKIDFRLGAMNFYYGLKNQDAYVGITIWKGSTLIAVLQDSTTLVRAKASDSAYQVKWDGKNDNGNASLSAGTYKIKISAVQLDGTALQPKYATFKVKTAKNILDMTPKNPKDTTGRNSAVYVAEAFLDSTGVFRYEPVADYRIDASVRGYRLPNDGLKNEIPLSGTVSGTQEIIGYEPKRFSLALKRHRKNLDLVVVSRRKGKLDEITGRTQEVCVPFAGCWDVASSCEETGHKDYDIIRTDVLHFDSEHRDTTIAYVLNYGGTGYGFDGRNGPKDGTIDFAVLTVSDYQRLFKSMPSSASDFELAKNYSVWKLTDYTSDSSEYKIPGNTSTGLKLMYSTDLGCNVVMKDSILDSTCVYGKSGTTTGYDPNKSLFKLSIKPNADGMFYSQKGPINSHCDDGGWLRYTYQQVNVVFEIPKDDYWDASIGMDNLVNRTIRFDHTNKTVFAKDSSSSDGYLAAMDSLARVKNDVSLRWANSYHNGSAFVFDKTYGLLTPFETQRLHFFPAGAFEGGLNMFLFADEDSAHAQDARFEMKFYGGGTSQDYFVAKTIGLPAAGESENGCNYDTLTNVLLGMGGERYCQIDHDSKTSNIKSTPYFSKNSNVEFYVGRNMVWSAETRRDTIPYPAQANWRDTLKKNECLESGQDWKFAENGSNPCFKYYDFGSRVHYYFADYVDSVWAKEILRTTNGTVLHDSIIANLANSPWEISRDPLLSSFVRNVDQSRIGSNDVGSGLNVKLDPDMYDATEHRFFVPLDSVRLVNSELVGGGVNARVDNLKSGVYPKFITFSGDEDSLYVKAIAFTKKVAYRKSEDPFAKPLVRPLQDTIPFSRLYTRPEWGRETILKSAKLAQLDGSEHTHFNLLAAPDDSVPLYVGFKRADSIPFHRLEEFVELYAYLEANRMYSLSYLNDTSFYSIKDSIVANAAGWRSLGWFNVNRLQGNTTFLLTWGDKSGASYNFSKFDMVIGARATSSGSKTVHSPLGEVSVSFPTNSLDGDKDVTIRSIDAKNYPFEVFNNLALNGPIMEALPRMTFADTANLPRVQMKISKEEMEAMHTSPETIKLYKVDFTQKKFVPLENALYGYLDADGHALLNNGFASDTAATCPTATDTRCYNKNKEWAYLLISAETRSFSVFTALDSAVAETPDYSIQVVPEVADMENRLILVTGISRYNLYVDDDAVWANRNDSTPPEALAYTLDSNGYAHVQLPSHGKALDTNYVFAVALSEPDSNGNVSELPAAPAVARAITVNTQFACHVPQDSLWLGLDNGYLAYAAGCTHPGYGVVSLYADGKLMVEFRGNMPDTLVYDGLLKTGGNDIGKIPYGVYESRYVGVSALGMDKQMAGPRIYTDSVRPSIDSFNVAVESELLDRIFRVSANLSDAESGIARVKITPVLGNKELKVIDALPDSAGFVNVSLRLTRKQLTDCSGCRLSLSFRVEDYGHNYNVRDYFSENLYPFPTELALWYPAYEGSGNSVHEIINGVHNLDVTRMNNKWGSDVGLYFSQNTDYAVGINGPVDFGSTPSYSFETRVKPGNPNDNAWHEILSFRGVNALDIRLLQNKQALELVEGTRVWKSGSILPPINKSWSHVVVTVDSDSVKFYVDGESKAARNSGISQERELEGVFSMGKAGSEPSYIGNIADIRMYSRALTAAEVEELSKPVTDAGEVSDVIVVAVKDMDAVGGFSNEFSCSVAGNKYLVSGDSATLAMSVIVENAADYNVVLYARSATVGDKSIYVGESNLLTGIASVSNTWRAVTVSGVSVHLAAGTHTLTLKVPAGVQIGGAALTTANIPASMIAWGVSTSDKVAGIVPADTARKVKSYLRYEGYPETSTLRPRIRLRNVSNEPVNGFSVRYYFRGEDASQAGVDRYWPNNVATFPAVHSESANTGYVEWSFAETIPVAGTVFGGDGPHFGLFNSDFTPWNASDDPSFVDPNSGLVANVDGFYEDAGMVVLDKDNNLIGGSCAEMEDPVSLETKVRVLAADMRGDNQASEIHFMVENTGNVSLKNFDVRYYFFVEEGLAPDYEINDKPECASASMERLGSGRWQVTVHCDKPLAAGKTWQNPVTVALHLPGWAAMWNANDDPSHDSLGMTMRVARGICVFDSAGYMLYGNAPVWALPAPDEFNPDSVYNVDFGYHAPGSVPVIRTPEGLVITMDSWTYVELSLVTALGTPVKSIFSGTLAPGEQFVHVDWTDIDMNRTYLMLKVNGTIKSTKKLSLL